MEYVGSTNGVVKERVSSTEAGVVDWPRDGAVRSVDKKPMRREQVLEAEDKFGSFVSSVCHFCVKGARGHGSLVVSCVSLVNVTELRRDFWWCVYGFV